MHKIVLSMANSCPECGYPLKGSEDKCPECGFIINPQISNETMDVDNWDYSQYVGGLFSQWYFECPNSDEEESYNTLNDILLLGNLIFRALWSIAWPLCLLYLLYFGLLFICSQNSPILGVFLTILFYACVILLLVIKLIPMAVHKYWVPFHRTWRRINKRYWINMYKAIKSKNSNIL